MLPLFEINIILFHYFLSPEFVKMKSLFNISRERMYITNEPFGIMVSSRETLSSEFPTRSCSNRWAQLQRLDGPLSQVFSRQCPKPVENTDSNIINCHKNEYIFNVNVLVNIDYGIFQGYISSEQKKKVYI